MIETYRPSGKFSPSYVVLAGVGLAVALGLAWVYQFLMDVIPLIYLNFLLTAGFGFALMMGMELMVNWGRCRNRTLAVATGLVIAAVAVGATHYFGYEFTLDEVADIEGLSDVQMEALRAELGFGTYLDIRVDSGWSLGRAGSSGDGAPISGLFVWLIWGIEAIGLIGAAVYGAFGAAKRPYCEPCGEWALEDQPFMFQAPSEQLIETVRSAASVQDLLAVEIDNDGRPNEGLVFKPSKCTSCADSRYLTVCRRKTSYDKDGKQEIDDEDILSNVILTPDQFARVWEIGVVDEAPADEEFDDWPDDESFEAASEDASEKKSPPEPALDGEGDGVW